MSWSRVDPQAWCRRAQTGHWKSPYSVMVTGAFASPTSAPPLGPTALAGRVTFARSVSDRLRCTSTPTTTAVTITAPSAHHIHARDRLRLSTRAAVEHHGHHCGGIRLRVAGEVSVSGERTTCGRSQSRVDSRASPLHLGAAG